jgi:transposase
MSPKQDLARERALIIMQVRSGRITAAQGAQRLGISRKTYYQWEKRALEGMMTALENQDAGRPARSVDTEKEQLKKKNRKLERELLLTQQRSKVKDLFLEKVNQAWPFLFKKRDGVKKKKPGSGS